MPRFEYLMVDTGRAESYDALQDEFNVLGRQEWELVTITSANSAVFKRPLADAVPGEEPSGPVSLMEGQGWPEELRPTANN